MVLLLFYKEEIIMLKPGTKATDNVAKAKARKQKNRLIKEEQTRQEATTLGISPEELIFKRYHDEIIGTIARNKQREKDEAIRRAQNSYYRGYWYQYLKSRLSKK